MQSLLPAFMLILFLSMKSSLAHAYLDPGSISLVLQAFAAAVAGAVLTGKYWFWRVLSLLGITKESEKTEKGKSASSDDD